MAPCGSAAISRSGRWKATARGGWRGRSTLPASAPFLDTAAAYILPARERDGASPSRSGRGAGRLLETVRKATPTPEIRRRRPAGGAACERYRAQSCQRADLHARTGRISGPVPCRILGARSGIRAISAFTSLVYHCQETGLRAVPIVALMSFLIGVVLAFQGARSLKYFGAEIFVVDLIAIAVLRELGILLTAIIVAGREPPRR